MGYSSFKAFAWMSGVDQEVDPSLVPSYMQMGITWVYIYRET